MKRTVIVHPEMGVYLGNCLGLGYFSLLDDVGQAYACVFLDEDQAARHIRNWDANNDPSAYRYVTVETPHEYADAMCLIAAGLHREAEPLARNEAALPKGTLQ